LFDSIEILERLRCIYRNIADYVLHSETCQQRCFILWSPYCLALGISVYFLVPFDISYYVTWVMIFAVVLAMAWIYIYTKGFVSSQLLVGYDRVEDRCLNSFSVSNICKTKYIVEITMYFICAVLLFSSGFFLAKWQTVRVAEPVIVSQNSVDKKYLTLLGRVIGVSQSSSGKLRLLFDDVQIEGKDHMSIPKKVQVSFLGHKASSVEDRKLIKIGQYMRFPAILSPPQGAAEPKGGFNYKLYAWFQGLGAVGFTKSSIYEAILYENEHEHKIGSNSIPLAVKAFRMRISSEIIDEFPGESGAMMAALTVGDRSWFDPDTINSMRISGLAHLLAISGLHMGAFCTAVFFFIRLVISLLPYLCLRVSSSKCAAICTLIFSFGYLVLAGASVSTQRAFIMAACVMLAILLDKPAISMRNVAIAAIIILVIYPSQLFSAGFQMSFAATTALVAFYDVIRRYKQYSLRNGSNKYDAVIKNMNTNSKFSKLRNKVYADIYKWGVALVFTSLVAGAATSVFGIYHFHRIANYSLLANILAVPIVTLIVMPCVVIWLFVFMLFGSVDNPAAWIIKLGIDIVLNISSMIESLPNSYSIVAAAPWFSLFLITTGGLWFMLWHGKVRLYGVGILLLGVVLWCMHDRPFMLVAPGGSLIGVMTNNGRAIDHPSASSYVAQQWLVRDGESVDGKVAAMRWKKSYDHRMWKVVPIENSWSIKFGLHKYMSHREISSLYESCSRKEIVILPRIAIPSVHIDSLSSGNKKYCNFKINNMLLSLCIIDMNVLNAYGSLIVSDSLTEASYLGGNIQEHQFKAPDIIASIGYNDDKAWHSIDRKDPSKGFCMYKMD